MRGQNGLARHEVDQRKIGPVAIDEQYFLEAMIGDALRDVDAEGDERFRLDVNGGRHCRACEHKRAVRRWSVGETRKAS